MQPSTAPEALQPASPTALAGPSASSSPVGGEHLALQTVPALKTNRQPSKLSIFAKLTREGVPEIRLSPDSGEVRVGLRMEGPSPLPASIIAACTQVAAIRVWCRHATKYHLILDA